MKELTLQNFREVVSLHDTAVSVNQLKDKDLLRSHLTSDLGLDSLDVIDMIAEFEVEYGVYIDSHAFDDKMYPSAADKTVATFLKVCNECQR